MLFLQQITNSYNNASWLVASSTISETSTLKDLLDRPFTPVGWGLVLFACVFLGLGFTVIVFNAQFKINAEKSIAIGAILLITGLASIMAQVLIDSKTDSNKIPTPVTATASSGIPAIIIANATATSAPSKLAASIDMADFLKKVKPMNSDDFLNFADGEADGTAYQLGLRVRTDGGDYPRTLTLAADEVALTWGSAPNVSCSKQLSGNIKQGSGWIAKLCGPGTLNITGPHSGFKTKVTDWNALFALLTQ